MRERKYVKFRVDMYEDTKFKIIDTKPEGDMIHYVWSRLVVLAGKSNREGELYLSRNIPYTIETLAIEFNREAAQIKLALDLFMELEMVEIVDGKIYRVKNFAKHQNIKVKEKIKTNDKEENENKGKAEFKTNESSIAEIDDNKGEESKNQISEDNSENPKGQKNDDIENEQKDTRNVEDDIKDKKINDNLQQGTTILLETKKVEKTNKKNKRNKVEEIGVIDEKISDDSVCCFSDGARILGEGERSVFELSFG